MLLVPGLGDVALRAISPAAETMGERLRALHRIALAHGDAAVAGPVVVAPVKALLQRLGVTPEGSRQSVVRRRPARLELEALVEPLVAMGYRREYQVEHRGELAVRGGIIDVFPSTGEVPVRIDCFGDEVERLTEFDLADQRSIDDLDASSSSDAESSSSTSVPAPAPARSPARLRSREGEFDRIAHGEFFDGMESFLPWLAPELTAAPRPPRGRATGSCSSMPGGPATGPASSWRRRRPRRRARDNLGCRCRPAAEDFPRFHAGFERLLEHAVAPRRLARSRSAEGPDGRGRCTAAGWPALIGDAGALARRVGELVGGASSVVVTAEGAGSAERLAGVLEGEGVGLEHSPGGERLR